MTPYHLRPSVGFPVDYTRIRPQFPVPSRRRHHDPQWDALEDYDLFTSHLDRPSSSNLAMSISTIEFEEDADSPPPDPYPRGIVGSQSGSFPGRHRLVGEVSSDLLAGCIFTCLTLQELLPLRRVCQDFKSAFLLAVESIVSCPTDRCPNRYLRSQILDGVFFRPFSAESDGRRDYSRPWRRKTDEVEMDEENAFRHQQQHADENEEDEGREFRQVAIRRHGTFSTLVAVASEYGLVESYFRLFHIAVIKGMHELVRILLTYSTERSEIVNQLFVLPKMGRARRSGRGIVASSSSSSISAQPMSLARAALDRGHRDVAILLLLTPEYDINLCNPKLPPLFQRCWAQVDVELCSIFLEHDGFDPAPARRSMRWVYEDRVARSGAPLRMSSSRFARRGKPSASHITGQTLYRFKKLSVVHWAILKPRCCTTAAGLQIADMYFSRFPDSVIQPCLMESLYFLRPIHLAVMVGDNYDIVRLLVEHGADVNTTVRRVSSGSSPSSRRTSPTNRRSPGRMFSKRSLRSQSAVFRSRKSRVCPGDTALTLGFKFGRSRTFLFDLLSEFEADPSIVNVFGESFLTLAPKEFLEAPPNPFPDEMFDEMARPERERERSSLISRREGVGEMSGRDGLPLESRQGGGLPREDKPERKYWVLSMSFRKEERDDRGREV